MRDALLRVREVARSQRLRKWAETLAIILFFLALRSTVASAYSVPTGSMEPTFLPGDRFFATRYSLDTSRFPWLRAGRTGGRLR